MIFTLNASTSSRASRAKYSGSWCSLGRAALNSVVTSWISASVSASPLARLALCECGGGGRVVVGVFAR